MNVFELDLDLAKEAGFEVVTIRQGDRSGTTIRANVYDHGELLAGSYTARFVMGLPDREHYYRADAAYADGVATVTLDEAYAASVAGTCEHAYFEVLSGSTVIASTESFRVVVLPSATADKTPGETYDSEIERTLAEMEQAIAQMDVSVEEAVFDWLDSHPEATTTVQDGAITWPKLADSLRQRLGNRLAATLTGPVSSISDAYASPLVGGVVYGHSEQDGTPTPDAPVEIASVDSLSVGCAGRNLQPFFAKTPISSVGGYWSGRSSYWTPTSDGWARFSRSAESATNTDISILPQAGLKVGQTYTVLLEWRNVTLSGTATMNMQADETRQLSTITATSITAGSGSSYVSTTCLHAADEQGITRFFYWRTRLQSGSTLEGEFRLSIYEGEYHGAYVPPVGATVPIDLQGHELRSLPDGTRDELAIDQSGRVTLVQRVGSVTLDGNGTGFVDAATMGGNCSRLTFANARFPNQSVAFGGCSLCTHAVDGSTSAGTQPPAGRYSKGAGAGLYLTLDPSFATAAEANAWVESAGVTFTYPLATPVEIDLGTVELPVAPAPELTLWTSSPDFELLAERDVNLYAERMEAQAAGNLAPADGPTATQSHATGSLLTLGGQLVKATRVIAVGEDIAIGTNVAMTTIADELALLA